jgi:5-methylcytosine-specific restriction protein A
VTHGLTVGAVYKRTDLHEKLGGARQSGIAPSAATPFVLLFSGPSGSKYGYDDGFQPSGEYWYTGEGQIGDMTLDGGNGAIVNAGNRGRTLLLFEEEHRSHFRLVGEARYLDHHWTKAPDRNGDLRRAIVFELEVAPESVPAAPKGGLPLPLPAVPAGLWKKSLSELRRLSLKPARHGAPKVEQKRIVRLRSEAVRVYVLKRAAGRCEGCGEMAPFMTAKGLPYLEPHHIYRLADGGPDHPSAVVGLCPNCHRRVHHGRDGAAFNHQLAQVVLRLEGNDATKRS